MVDKGVSLTDEQIRVLDKLLDFEVCSDDPSLTKKKKKQIMGEIRKTRFLPDGLWYELAEARGFLKWLDEEEQEVIKPVLSANFEGGIGRLCSKPSLEDD